ncbi:tetraspanin-1 [Discoglossus pictus]
MNCFTFIKVVMIIFNTLIFLGGSTRLGIGIWVAVDSKSFLKIFGSVDPSIAAQFVNVGYFLIVLGCLLFIIGFIGCCGAQKESKCLLLVFFSIILVIFVAEIASAVVALVYSNLAENLLKPLIGPVLKNEYGNPKYQETTNVWNQTMHELQCCGFTGYNDFANSYFTNSTGHYPPSCCYNATMICDLANAQAQNQKGCFRQVLDAIKQNADIVGGVAAGICTLELAAMIVSMALYCHLDKGGSVH